MGSTVERVTTATGMSEIPLVGTMGEEGEEGAEVEKELTRLTPGEITCRHGCTQALGTDRWVAKVVIARVLQTIEQVMPWAG